MGVVVAEHSKDRHGLPWVALPAPERMSVASCDLQACDFHLNHTWKRRKNQLKKKASFHGFVLTSLA